MEEYEKKFLELPRYASYIKDEKENTQILVNGLPILYKDKIQFDKSKTLEEMIKKAKYLYNHIKGRVGF
jgi:hypothetical protein